jgi:hypothetical protein
MNNDLKIYYYYYKIMTKSENNNLHDINIHSILKKFPSFDLPYQKNIFNKVNNIDYILAIPKGIKCFLWFTNFNNNPTYFLLELHENKKIKNIHQEKIYFKNPNINIFSNWTLGYGTIFYGTKFYLPNIQNHTFFTIEDVIFFQGKKVNCFFPEKLSMIKLFLENVHSSSFTKEEDSQYFNIGLPIFSKKGNEFDYLVSKSLYKISHLQYKFTNKFDILNWNINKLNNNQNTDNDKNIQNNITNVNNNNNYKNNNNNKIVFKVIPDIQNDIYHLYTSELLEGSNTYTDLYYDIALIPNFETSKLMNQLFRKIKENDNLDTLEESDDEDEFQNNQPDKFVFLNKHLNMECKYNSKFNKWYPIKVADDTDSIVFLDKINNFTKNYNNYSNSYKNYNQNKMNK